MRQVFVIFAVWVGLSVSPMPSPAATAVSISVFHNDLAPYGRWVNVSPYGSAWIPTRVSSGWRPYTNGYWAYTDYGWSWVSYEPFGNDVYHYGRWLHDPYQGWMWIPGTQWAPAWVAWQESDDYVGWAPLPPDSRWGSSGLVYSVSSISTPSWVFVQRPYFLNRHITTRIVPVTRNVTVLRTTRDVTHFDVVKGKPANRGIDVAHVQSTSGKKINKTYTSQRQNVRTQKRVQPAHANHVERRTKVQKRNETTVASGQDQRAPTQKYSGERQHGSAEKGQKNKAGKGKGGNN